MNAKNEKLRESEPKYQEIFKTYLNFCPFFRMTLFNMKDLHSWIKKLKFDLWFNEFSNFFIFMSFLSDQNFIKPFFKFKDPRRGPRFRIIGEEEWRNWYQEGYISFLDEENLNEPRLEFKKIKDKIGKIETWHFYDIYYYHPIQFIQLLSLLNHINIEFFRYKDFLQYYYNMFYSLENYKPKQFKKYLEENSLTLEDFLQKEYLKDGTRYPLLQNRLKLYKWLTPLRFKIYIKIEKVSNLSIFSPDSLKPYRNFLKNANEYPKSVHPKDIEQWFNNFESNKNEIFTEAEIKQIEDLLRNFKIYEGDLNGLEKWEDLVYLINRDAKDQLTGFLSYYANMIEIKKALERIIWFLRTEDIENSSDRPDFWPIREEEVVKYRNQVLYKYNLIPSYVFILYVEGPTEEVIFKDWLPYQPYGYLVDVKIMEGADDIDAITRCTVKKFKDRQYFFLLDFDSKKYFKRRVGKLRQANVKENQYYFFKPDFITENFTAADIIFAYDNWLKDEKINIAEELSNNLREKLIHKEPEEKFEKIVEEFNNAQEDWPPFSKPQFARFLSKIINIESKKKFSMDQEEMRNRRKFPFENIVYEKKKFFEQILEFIDLDYINYIKKREENKPK